MNHGLLLSSLGFLAAGCIVYDDGGFADPAPPPPSSPPPVVVNAAPWFEWATAAVVLADDPNYDLLDFQAVVTDPDTSLDIVDVYVDVWDAYDDSPYPVDTFLLDPDASNTYWSTSWYLWETDLWPDYYPDYYLAFYVIDAYGDGEEYVIDFTYL